MASTLPSITRATAKRAVHLRITPRPSNIGESREIMRLVSQFGEVEYFKSLKYDTLSAPNTAIVIFREEEAAQHCLKKDPIRFRMGRAPVRQQRAPEEEQQQQQKQTQPQQINPFEEQQESQLTTSSARSRPPQNSPWGVTAPSHRQTRALSTPSSTLPKPPPNPLDLPGFSHQAQAPASESRIFEIRANPARVSFRDQLNTSHFHGHFAYDTQSTAQQDLLKRVPIPGLSDVNWRAEGKLWKKVEKERELHAAFRGSGKRKRLTEIYEEVKKEGRRGGSGQRDALSGWGVS